MLIYTDSWVLFSTSLWLGSGCAASVVACERKNKLRLAVSSAKLSISVFMPSLPPCIIFKTDISFPSFVVHFILVTAEIAEASCLLLPCASLGSGKLWDTHTQQFLADHALVCGFFGLLLFLDWFCRGVCRSQACFESHRRLIRF